MRISMTQATWAVTAALRGGRRRGDRGRARRQPPQGGRQGAPPAAGRAYAAAPGGSSVPPPPFPDAAQVGRDRPAASRRPDVQGARDAVEPRVPAQRRHAHHREGRPAAHRARRHARSAARRRNAGGVRGRPGRACSRSPSTRSSRQNQFVYLTYSKAARRRTGTTALARGRFDGKALVDVKDLLVTDNCNTGGVHFGSKLAFGRDGMLYMTVGERNDRNRAQNTNIHGGKILRLKDDGDRAARQSVRRQGGVQAGDLHLRPPQPAGAGDPSRHRRRLGDRARTAGRRRAQPDRGGQELRLAGRSPTAANTAARSSARSRPEGIEQPFMFWSPSPGLSGMAFYTGDKFPGGRDSCSSARSPASACTAWASTRRGLAGREAMLTTLRQRIRDVRQGPDGFLYLVVDANPGGILRVEPATPAADAGSGSTLPGPLGSGRCSRDLIAGDPSRPAYDSRRSPSARGRRLRRDRARAARPSSARRRRCRSTSSVTPRSMPAPDAMKMAPSSGSLAT